MVIMVISCNIMVNNDCVSVCKYFGEKTTEGTASEETERSRREGSKASLSSP